MKTFNKFFGIGAAAIIALGFASCTNEVKDPGMQEVGKDGATLNLLKSPDAIVWSGQTVFGNTFGRAGDASEILDGMDEGFSLETTDGFKHINEVEVNLSLLNAHTNPKWDQNISDLVTKLSIHVRCATNVEVILPVPSRYVIESDDLYIFQEHYGTTSDGKGGYLYEGAYGTSDTETTVEGHLVTQLNPNANQTLDYKVVIGKDEAGNDITRTVTLHVDFILANPDAENELDRNGYIKVYTEGINEEVFAACYEHNGDGLNFEIYNYYQTAEVEWKEGVKDGIVTGILSDETLDEIKEALNNSTIDFKEFTPYYYINAFGYAWTDDESGAEHAQGTHGTDVNLNDCTVAPVSELFGEPVEAEHLNGTPYNMIYSSVANPDDAHVSHNEAETHEND